MRPMPELTSAQREQLIWLRRCPEEKPASSKLRDLYRHGLVDAVPLLRPSGKPSRYREWSITDRGREILKVGEAQ
jgi:hypothetical protein